MIKIGKLKLKNPYFLAPMLGVNCAAFRLMCKQYGAGLVYGPMIHSIGLVRGDTEKMMADYWKDERPIAIQIIGNDPKVMVESVELLELLFRLVAKQVLLQLD